MQGPIDYILVEWIDFRPNGEAMSHLLDLVDRGIVRVLDLAFITRNLDGSTSMLEVADVGAEDAGLAVFSGVSSGLIQDDDVQEAGGALEPGASAALLVYENVWAAPFVDAIRRSGGELVASGRIPAEEVIAALDLIEAA